MDKLRQKCHDVIGYHFVATKSMEPDGSRPGLFGRSMFPSAGSSSITRPPAVSILTTSSLQAGTSPSDSPGVLAPAASPRVDCRSVISEFLRSNTCYDLLEPSGRTVVFDTKIAINLAFFALAENEITAAPLWDTEQQQFVGMVTSSDFVEVIRYFYYDGTESISDSNSIMGRMSSMDISQWRNFSLRDRRIHGLLYISPEDSLYTACKFLDLNGTHRLPVLDPTERIILKVLTHLNVMEYLCSMFRDERPLFESTIAELGIGTFVRTVVLPRTVPLIQVLDHMSQHKVSAVPLLDELGLVVDIYSRADVTLLAREGQLSLLDSPVMEVMALQRAEGLAVSQLFTCRRSDSLRRIFEMYAAARVHCLVCIDEEGRPEGVVSLTDVFGYFVR